MRAVILTTGNLQGENPLLNHRPSCLLPIADKSILCYILEFLSHHGWKKCDLFVSDFPHLVEEEIGEGRRWGLEFNFYLLKDSAKPFGVIGSTVEGWPDELLLFVQGDSLPLFSQERLNLATINKETLFVYPEGQWSGWGLFSKKTLSSIPKNLKLDEFSTFVENISEKIVVPSNLSTQSLLDFKKSNEGILTKAHYTESIISTAKMVEPNIWISHGVLMHPSVSILAPVFIGENTQLKERVQIGPNAVISNHCIIDKESVIQNSVVCPFSYVGEGLNIDQCIINRNTLINTTLDSHIQINEDFILSGLASPTFTDYPLLLLERVIGLFLLTLLSPIYLILLGTSKLIIKNYVSIPCYDKEFQTFAWKRFESGFFKHLPVLINVIKGQVHFVGIAPRTVEDVKKLPPDYQNFYLKSKIGLITLCGLNHGPYASEDEQYASEVYYTAHKTTAFDTHLVWLWIKKKLGSW